MTTETYQERINRFRVVKHEELPEAHKAEYRLNGIDPDDNWTLVWSFNDKDAADKCCADEIENDKDICAKLTAKGYDVSKRKVTWKVVDAGAATVVERQAWF